MTQSDENINITSELLDNLEKTSGLRLIINQQEFNKMIKLAKTIVYISVNWSIQERISRKTVYNILNDRRIIDLPIFKIDCSEQKNKYVEEWLINQPTSMQSLYFDGYGETLLIKNGQVIDFIKYPGELGVEKTKLKIEHWLT